jgi:hypothetical protein
VIEACETLEGNSPEERRWLHYKEAAAADGSATETAFKKFKVADVADQGEPTFILAFGPIGRRRAQRITLHKLGHQSCVRARNPEIELKEWQALSTVDESDFNWKCRLCFSELRVNAKARKTEDYGLITEEEVTKQAIAEDGSASESDTESSSTDGEVDIAMASPSKAKGEADKAKRLYPRQSSFSPRQFSTLGPPGVAARARFPLRSRSPCGAAWVGGALWRALGSWGVGGSRGVLGLPLSPISGFPHREACGGRRLSYGMQDVFWSGCVPQRL